jgi:phosphoserine phosphatase
MLISVQGRDRPGVTASLAGAMSEIGIRILDLGQAVIHDTLAWGILVEIPDRAHTASLYRDLLHRAHELDLTIRLRPVDDAEYERWVADKGQPRFIVTLLGTEIDARHVARVASTVSDLGLNIERIQRLSGRSPRAPQPLPSKMAIEFAVRGPIADESAVRKALLETARGESFDVGIQADDAYRRNRRLVCFDMDSTLIQIEVIDELARRAGVLEEVSRITQAAMSGEIDFETSFRRRMAAIAGLPESELAAVAENLPLTEGAERLVGTLKRLGYRVAIISGGFTYFARRLQEMLGVDYVHAHELVIADGKLTGEVSNGIIDGPRKAELMRGVAAREGIGLQQVIAVGDGANDIPMLTAAGLGVAFHAKPIVNERAQHAIGSLGLDGILYLLGMRDREFEELS